MTPDHGPHSTQGVPRPGTEGSAAAQEPEHIEADYKFAADAWLSGKMTIAAMDYGVRCQRIALEYAKRLELEKAGHPLGPYEETP